MFKRFTAIFIVLILVLSMVGCAGGSQILAPYKFNEDLKTYNINI